MSSLKQIRANRRNAKKSTGPTTKAGKENSRFNALVHGLRAESNLLPGEDAPQFDQLLESLTVGWRPQDDREKSMIERIATAQWKLARLDCGISLAILDLDRYRKRLKRVKDKSSDDDRDFRPGPVTSMNGGPPYFDVQPQISASTTSGATFPANCPAISPAVPIAVASSPTRKRPPSDK